mgnify:CR=1 FL=1
MFVEEAINHIRSKYGTNFSDAYMYDGNKVIIHTVDYTPVALEKIGSMRIIPKHIWEKVDDPEKFSGEGDIVGSGPYKLVAYNSEQGSYKMEKNNEFWGLEAAATRIEWIPVSDRVLAFQNGEIDITVIPVDLLKNFENNKEFKIIHRFNKNDSKFQMMLLKDSINNELIKDFIDFVRKYDVSKPLRELKNKL